MATNKPMRVATLVLGFILLMSCTKKDWGNESSLDGQKMYFLDTPVAGQSLRVAIDGLPIREIKFTVKNGSQNISKACSPGDSSEHAAVFSCFFSQSYKLLNLVADIVTIDGASHHLTLNSQILPSVVKFLLQITDSAGHMALLSNDSSKNVGSLNFVFGPLTFEFIDSIDGEQRTVSWEGKQIGSASKFSASITTGGIGVLSVNIKRANGNASKNFQLVIRCPQSTPLVHMTALDITESSPGRYKYVASFDGSISAWMIDYNGDLVVDPQLWATSATSIGYPLYNGDRTLSYVVLNSCGEPYSGTITARIPKPAFNPDNPDNFLDVEVKGIGDNKEIPSNVKNFTAVETVSSGEDQSYKFNHQVSYQQNSFSVQVDAMQGNGVVSTSHGLGLEFNLDNIPSECFDGDLQKEVTANFMLQTASDEKSLPKRNYAGTGKVATKIYTKKVGNTNCGNDSKRVKTCLLVIEGKFSVVKLSEKVNDNSGVELNGSFAFVSGKLQSTETCTPQPGCSFSSSEILRVGEPGEFNVDAIGTDQVSLSIGGAAPITVKVGKVPYTPTAIGEVKLTGEATNSEGTASCKGSLSVMGEGGGSCVVAGSKEAYLGQTLPYNILATKPGRVAYYVLNGIKTTNNVTQNITLNEGRTMEASITTFDGDTIKCLSLPVDVTPPYCKIDAPTSVLINSKFNIKAILEPYDGFSFWGKSFSQSTMTVDNQSAVNVNISDLSISSSAEFYQVGMHNVEFNFTMGNGMKIKCSAQIQGVVGTGGGGGDNPPGKSTCKVAVANSSGVNVCNSSYYKGANSSETLTVKVDTENANSGSASAFGVDFSIPFPPGSVTKVFNLSNIKDGAYTLSASTDGKGGSGGCSCTLNIKTAK